MKIMNKEHSKLISEMLSAYGITSEPSASENMSAGEMVQALLLKVNRDGIPQLIKYLANSDFYTAPASTRFHGNYEGGLAEHSVNVCAILRNLNITHNLGLSDETIILTSLMHDLCKVNFYKKGTRNVKDERGNWYAKEIWEVDDKMPLGHGEKSVYILQSFVKLSREEVFLIRWHMGPFACATGDQYGFNNAVDYQKSIALMYTADFLASSLYEAKID